MKNQIKHGKKYLKIEFLTNDNQKLVYYTEEPCEYYIVNIKGNKTLKIAIAGIMDSILKKGFEAKCTLKWVYIPIRYVKSVKEGVSKIKF